MSDLGLCWIFKVGDRLPEVEEALVSTALWLVQHGMHDLKLRQKSGTINAL